MTEQRVHADNFTLLQAGTYPYGVMAIATWGDEANAVILLSHVQGWIKLMNTSEVVVLLEGGHQLRVHFTPEGLGGDATTAGFVEELRDLLTGGSTDE